MIDYSKEGFVKAIRDINGKIVKEVVIDGVKYRRNPTYKTYNSVKDNQLLHKSKYAKGGKVKAKKEINEGLKELEEALAGASKKHKAQSKMVGQIQKGFDATFEEGGLIGGRRHSQGGTIIEAERG